MFLLAGFLALNWWHSYRWMREREAFDAEREKWRLERAELLNRIQHPEVFQPIMAGGRSGTSTSDVADDVVEAVAGYRQIGEIDIDRLVADEADLVGTIQTGEPSGD